MEICSNCFRSKTGDHLFCPWCGFPTRDVGLKRCNKGHIIFESFKSCVFCLQAGNLGKSFLNAESQEKTPTEVVRTAQIDKTVLEDDGMDRMFESAPGEEPELTVTIMEEDPLGKTILEEDPLEKTMLEDFDDRTRIDAGSETVALEPDVPPAPGEERPSFFAWMVYTDEEGLPVRDIRLTKEKSIIGKGEDADIRVTDDFVSRLHALIYFENGCFYLSDLGSTNGTFLNDQKVMKEVLKDGDRVRIGHKPMIFKQVTKRGDDGIR
ncbi:MAG: FHA domain-containing protein [bacterium]|nr:FHA domain-containing protein [bacterium]